MDSAKVDDVVRDTICVARLGEADLRNWWASRAFGTAGRVVLKQRLPRTWRMAAVELDLASATNRHNDVINRPNAVHLFSDNWPVRRWAAAWVAEQKTAPEPATLFDELEHASLEAIEAHLQPGNVDKARPAAGAHRMGTINRSDLDNHTAIVYAARTLATAYVGSESFIVPYLEVSG